MKNLVMVLCAVALLLVGGYVGMRIAPHLDFSSQRENISADSAVDTGFTADIGVPADAGSAANIGSVAEIGEAVPDAQDFVVPAGISPSGRTYMSFADLFEGSNPAVVAISTEMTGRNAFGQIISRPASGSGFFVSPNGYIVTNDHVIENAQNITVLLYDGTAHPATVVGRDADSDIAVIKIDVSNWSYLTFADSDMLRVGDQVAAIGNPLGELANTMTVGIISALNREISVDGTTRTKLQTDAAINRGNSGGPLLNLRGEVVGVVNAKSVGANVEGLGFAITADQAREVTEQLIEYGFVRGRAILGVTIREIQQVGGQGRLVQIASTAENSAAQRAGIRADDIILQINETPISSFNGLRTVLDALSPGDEIEVRIRRGAEELTVTAVLDEYRPQGL